MAMTIDAAKTDSHNVVRKTDDNRGILQGVCQIKMQIFGIFAGVDITLSQIHTRTVIWMLPLCF
jgi:hypothetical protein